jgi:hypothetical protein
VTALAYNANETKILSLVFQSLEFIEFAEHFLVRMLLEQTEDNHAQGGCDKARE